MIPDLQTLKQHAKTAGDSATLLLFGAVGYVAGVGLDASNFEPGACGFVAAALGLGTKKAVEAQRARERYAAAADSAIPRAVDLVRFLAERGFIEEAELLKRDLDLVERGILGRSVLPEAIAHALAAYRRAPAPPALPASSEEAAPSLPSEAAGRSSPS